MKKIMFLLVAGLVGFGAYADCTMSVVSVTNPKSNVLYPAQKGMLGLVCGGACSIETSVYASEKHYVGDKVVENATLYRCTALGWVPTSFNQLPKCSNIVAKASGMKAMLTKKEQQKVEGIQIGQGFYTDPCRVENDTNSKDGKDIKEKEDGNNGKAKKEDNGKTGKKLQRGQIKKIDGAARACKNGLCSQWNRSYTINGGCDNGNDADCKGIPTGSAASECLSIEIVSGGDKYWSCSAKSCGDNYLLWYDYDWDNVTPVNMGICHPLTDAENKCRQPGKCECDPDEDCKINYRADEMGNPKGGYLGCTCQPKDSVDPENGIGNGTGEGESAGGTEAGGNNGNPEPETKCTYTFKHFVLCPNGNFRLQQKAMPVSKNMMEKINADDCTDFERQFSKDNEHFQEIVDEWCKDGNLIAAYTLDMSTQNAINEITSFFGEKKTVWRDEEGKFNTRRLASDATAAVILGTVGGVVSGKVIKKKQLEKGFDVLHCTVGGQNMADYGDTFQVSYRR